MVDILNELFSRFDAVAARYRLEKIKTVGDAYLAARGLHAPGDDDAAATADAALAMQQAVLAVARGRQRALSLRVGISRGEAMSGVLGRERPVKVRELKGKGRVATRSVLGARERRVLRLGNHENRT